MITYQFEAKCDQCGHETVAAGPIVLWAARVKGWEDFVDLLRDLGWRLATIDGKTVLICPSCAKNAS